MKKKLLTYLKRAEWKLPRFLICLCISILLAALFVGVLPTKGEEDVYDRFIRLHVLANSDSEDDQALKLRVRDAVISYIAGISGGEPLSVSEAEARYRAVLPEIEAAAAEVIADAGYDYPCRVTLTRETYPARTYGDYTLPAGEYRSLRVLIGDAAGHNWFCVLFPPMCLSLATEYREADVPTPPAGKLSVSPDSEELLLSAGFTPYEVSLLAEKGGCVRTVVKFRIVELIKKLFRG